MTESRIANPAEMIDVQEIHTSQLSEQAQSVDQTAKSGEVEVFEPKLDDEQRLHLEQLRSQLQAGELPEDMKRDFNKGRERQISELLDAVTGRLSLDTDVRMAEKATHRANQDNIHSLRTELEDKVSKSEQAAIRTEVANYAKTLHETAAAAAKAEHAAKVAAIESRTDLDKGGKKLLRAHLEADLEKALKPQALDARNADKLSAKNADLQGQLAAGMTAEKRAEAAVKAAWREKMGLNKTEEPAAPESALQKDNGVEYEKKFGIPYKEWIELSGSDRAQLAKISTTGRKDGRADKVAQFMATRRPAAKTAEAPAAPAVTDERIEEIRRRTAEHRARNGRGTKKVAVEPNQEVFTEMLGLDMDKKQSAADRQAELRALRQERLNELSEQFPEPGETFDFDWEDWSHDKDDFDLSAEPAENEEPQVYDELLENEDARDLLEAIHAIKDQRIRELRRKGTLYRMVRGDNLTGKQQKQVMGLLGQLRSIAESVYGKKDGETAREYMDRIDGITWKAFEKDFDREPAAQSHANTSRASHKPSRTGKVARVAGRGLGAGARGGLKVADKAATGLGRGARPVARVVKRETLQGVQDLRNIAEAVRQRRSRRSNRGSTAPVQPYDVRYGRDLDEEDKES